MLLTEQEFPSIDVFSIITTPGLLCHFCGLDLRADGADTCKREIKKKKRVLFTDAHRLNTGDLTEKQL